MLIARNAGCENSPGEKTYAGDDVDAGGGHILG